MLEIYEQLFLHLLSSFEYMYHHKETARCLRVLFFVFLRIQLALYYRNFLGGEDKECFENQCLLFSVFIQLFYDTLLKNNIGGGNNGLGEP